MADKRRVLATVTEAKNLSTIRRRHRAPAGGRGKKPMSSDQAPGEETVQVNDKYVGGGPPPTKDPAEHIQHQTGG